jgi:hypothetical protein
MANYIWPLSGTSAAPDINTSFGPRVNRQRWDFHDGIDLKAPLGTVVFAMQSGIVHRAGPAGTHGYSSRHVVLKVDDPTDGVLYLVHVHLATIAESIVQGALVAQGQAIGTVGDDDANYPHLHFEFRKSKPNERHSVHPLRYLPYVNTVNFTAPDLDRCNRLGELLAARLRFGSPTRAEGDLLRVEVDLFSLTSMLERRVVDFDDKTTINDGIGDDLIFVNDIGVEGYQRSDLAGDGRHDLQYGILVRNLPPDCARVLGRVIDVGGNIVEGADAVLPNQEAVDESVEFEDGVLPPPGWRIRRERADEDSVVIEPGASCQGSNAMRCTAHPPDGGGPAAACIVTDLPPGRFEWLAEGGFNLTGVQLAAGKTLRLIEFRTINDQLSAAARIRQTDEGVRVGLVARNPDGWLMSEDAASGAGLDGWQTWRLHVRRVGTRESTAVLSVDGAERVRLNWDTTAADPRAVRTGITRIPDGGNATVLVDYFKITEATALL